MKTLVVYYSRTGTTRKVAEEIAKLLKADIDEVVDLKNREGPINYVIAGKDASMKKLTEIKTKKDASKYDLVIIGTPIWNWTVTPAIRTYLTKNKVKQTAFFCTMGGSGDKKAFDAMEELSKKPKATLTLLTKEVTEEKHLEKVKEFVAKLS